MLSGLQREGLSVILIMSIIAKEVRMLARMTAAVQQGQDIQTAMKGFFIYPKRKNLLIQALRNSQAEHWQKLLKQLLLADKIAKGAEQGNPWDMMQLVLAQVADKQYLDSEL